MGKSRWPGYTRRQLSSDELIGRFDEDLDLLLEMATQYDGGLTSIFGIMAVVLQKALIENNAGVRLRGQKLFPSNSFAPGRVTDHPYHRLVALQLGALPPRINFVPHFKAGALDDDLKFAVWWEQVVYVPHPIGGLEKIGLPIEAAQSLRRVDVITAVRNKLAAHQDSDILGILEDLERGYSWGNVIFEVGQTTLSTADESLPIAIPPLRAMVREICHEALVAFGKCPRHPNSTKG